MSKEIITIQCSGTVNCRSRFYTTRDIVDESRVYRINSGINKAEGEIDSGIWSVSYLMSMFDFCQQDIEIFEPRVTLYGKPSTFSEICSLSCYLDPMYMMFSTEQTVGELIVSALGSGYSSYKPEDIRDMFSLDSERFARPVIGTGSDLFRAMAAISFSMGKEIFCFPWMSAVRYELYKESIDSVVKKLEELGKTIVMPLGKK